MSADTKSGTGPRPFYTWAAWLSLIVPLTVAGLYLMLHDPTDREHNWIFPVLLLVFVICCCSGGVSLLGVRTNGAWVILPPALLGMLVSVLLGLLALIFWGLSGLPRSP